MKDILLFIDSLREFSMLSVAIRMVLAVLCGGFVGIEREHKRRPAGYRTHILVCLGAAMTTITSQYLLVNGWTTDPARLGAQVVAGIGFIGAGTIIVTRRRKVKGLTTAAGLWVSAIIGLAIGVGYFEAGVIATVMVLLAEIVLSKFEWYISSKAKNVNVYIEYDEDENIAEIADEIKKLDVNIVDIEITRSKAAEGPLMAAIFVIQLSRKSKRTDILQSISRIHGITVIEEL